jgi:ribonuclease Y
MDPIIIIFIILTIILASITGVLFTRLQTLKLQKKELENNAKNLTYEEKAQLLDSISIRKIEEAKQKAEDIVKNAQRESIEKKKEIAELEKAVFEREKVLTQKSETLLSKEKRLEQEEHDLESMKEDLKKEKSNISVKLSEVAKLSKDEARKELLNQVKSDLESDLAKEIRTYRDRILKESTSISQEILVDAMTTSATDYVAEYTTTVFPVAGEAIKGKIIGKEGRNIKTFEKITGVELIMDEADDYIVISCFDPLRRELAKIALTKLVKDGRIHPAKIEEFVQKARIDLAKQIIKDGEEIAFKAGFPGLSVEHLKYLGRMRYRFSYGQNLGTHVLEVVNISGKIAAELGLNVKLAKECALWHDIGKVVSHEKEGDHMELGEEIGRKLGLKEEVINAMYAHHMAKDPICMESAIIYIADANSGARPGARYGKDEDYVKRIKELEDIAKNIEGVKDAYAVDAGREVRVFVDPIRASDDRIIVMSNDIAKEIQETQTYPGTIKVTVIREVRASAMAK